MHGKTNEPLIIVDADAIIALSSTSDANYEKAKHILQILVTQGAATLFPTTAICEAVTVLKGRLNRPDDASSIIKHVQSGDFPLQPVDKEILSEATKLFHPHGSKKNTLFDAVIAAIAKQQNADAIFSFDGWYRKIGLKITDDLIPQSKAAA